MHDIYIYIYMCIYIYMYIYIYIFLPIYPTHCGVLSPVLPPRYAQSSGRHTWTSLDKMNCFWQYIASQIKCKWTCYIILLGKVTIKYYKWCNIVHLYPINTINNTISTGTDLPLSCSFPWFPRDRPLRATWDMRRPKPRCPCLPRHRQLVEDPRFPRWCDNHEL